MILSQDSNESNYQIHSYEPGLVTINEQNYEHSVIISPSQLVSWSPRTLADLQAEHWQAVLDIAPDVVLLGTGANFSMPQASVLAPLYDQQISVECMATRSACYTYQVLTSEKRNVVAALLIA